MKPFKLRVDWTCADAYPGEPVEVELDVMDEERRVLRYFPSTEEAAAWADKWLLDRGFVYFVQWAWHESMGHKYITMHAVPDGPWIQRTPV